MNAILLGGAALGALVAMYSSPMASTPLKDSAVQDRGSMTHTIQVDRQTGETTTIDVIAFQD